MGQMHQRRGDIGAASIRNAAEIPAHGWRQSWGHVLTVDGDLQQVGTVSPTSEGRLNGFQAGTDVWADPNWSAGLYVGRLDGDMEVRGFARGIVGYEAGHNELRNEYLGGYPTYQMDTGLYLAGVAQAGRHRTTMSTARSTGSSSQGDSLLASIEAGQLFAIASNWSLEPQLQLVHQRLRLDDTIIVGAVVQQDTPASWAARLGLRVKGEFRVGIGSLQPYARVDAWHTGSGTDRARFIGPAASTDILTPTGGTTTEAAVGATWQISPVVGVYGELGKLRGSGGNTKISSGQNATVGVKLLW